MSEDTISKITDWMVEEMTEWANRLLDPVYPVVFVTARCDPNGVASGGCADVCDPSAANTFTYASEGVWARISNGSRPVWQAATEDAAEARFAKVTQRWAGKYPAVVRHWENAWEQFTPFLQWDLEIRTRLHDQRDRIVERPLPAGCQRQGPFPQ